MADFLLDTFTDADGTALTAHTGEIGASWSVIPSHSGFVIRGNRAYSPTATGGNYASGVPASQDYDVEAQMYCASVAGAAGVIGRVSTSAVTFYHLRYFNTAAAWQLYKFVNGAATQLGSNSAAAYAPGDTATPRLVMRGNQISGVLNGVTIIGPVTDNSITAAGRAGVRNSGTAASETTGWQFDSITATDVAGSANLAPASAAQAQTASSPTLAAKSGVAPASAAQAQAATSPAISARSAVAPASAVQAQAAAEPTLAAHSSLAPASAEHSQAAGEPTVSASSAMAPASAAHVQVAESSQLMIAGMLAPATATQLQIAGEPVIMARSSLVPASASHSQAAGVPTLAAASALAPFSAAHAQVATEALLSVAPALLPASAFHLQFSTSPQISGDGQVDPDVTAGRTVTFLGAGRVASFPGAPRVIQLEGESRHVLLS